MVAKPCATVAAWLGRGVSRRFAPESRSVRSPIAPPPRQAQNESERVCLVVGTSVCMATSISSSRVSGPRFGATPERIQALRLSYMIPRVPSMGSTIRRNAACDAGAPSGKTRSPEPGTPSAINTNGISRPHSSQNSVRTASPRSSMA